MKKNWNDLKELFKINLIYLGGKSSHAMIERQRKKGKEEQSIYKSILGTQIATMLGLTLLYIFIMMPFPVEEIPVYFDNMTMLLLILGIVQSYTMFYNVLYEAGDVESYLSLPIEPRLIYISKLLAILLGSFVFVLPIAGMMMAFLYKINMPIWISILLFFYVMLVASSIFLLVNVVLMEFLIRSGLIKVFSKKIMNIINIILQFSMIGVVIWIQFTSMNFDFESASEGVVEYGFFTQFLAPNGKPWIFFAVTLGIILLAILSIYFLGRNFREQFLFLQQGQTKTKKTKKADLKTDSKRKSMVKYKSSLINDITVISQTLLLPVIFMISPFISFINMASDFLAEEMGLVFLLFAIIIPLVLSGVPYNLPELMISLDNENYEYLKTMPMNRREYVILSGLIAGAASGIVPFIGLLAIGILSKVNIFIFILGMGIFTIHHFLLSVKNTLKDEKNPSIGWKSLAEIFQRDNKFKLMFRMMGYLILLQIVVISSVFLSKLLIEFISFYSILIGVVAISILLALIYFLRLEKTFEEIDF